MNFDYYGMGELWVMAACYLSLQESPYLFTYRNSNYQTQRLKPIGRLQVRGRQPCVLVSFHLVLCVLKTPFASGHAESCSYGNCNRSLKFSQSDRRGTGADSEGPQGYVWLAFGGLDPHPLRPISLQQSQHHEVLGFRGTVTRYPKPSTNLWLVLEPFI